MLLIIVSNINGYLRNDRIRQKLANLLIILLGFDKQLFYSINHSTMYIN